MNPRFIADATTISKWYIQKMDTSIATNNIFIYIIWKHIM